MLRDCLQLVLVQYLLDVRTVKVSTHDGQIVLILAAFHKATKSLVETSLGARFDQGMVSRLDEPCFEDMTPASPVS